MLSASKQNPENSKIIENDEINHTTIESVLEWLSDSSVHPRIKVNTIQWFHIPTLLANFIQPSHPHQHEQEQDQQDPNQLHKQHEQQDEEPAPSAESNNQLLTQLLQALTKFLDQSSDSHTPIPNKRLLHSSLSHLSTSPALTLSMRREIDRCLVALNYVDDSSFAEQKQQPADQTQLEREVAMMRADKDAFVSTVISLQREKDQLRTELASTKQKLDEMERRLTQAQQTIEATQTAVIARTTPVVASDVIVAFSPTHFRLNGSIVTKLTGTHCGCFTKPISKGIHRMSIKTTARVNFGVLDASDYPNRLTFDVYDSPKAALMYNDSGCLYSARRPSVKNTIPQKGQEWSAEADLEKRTLHFFLDGVQQPHHFIDIPVPLVFAIEAYDKDATVEILSWGELKQSHVTFEGTGRKLG
ncbi:hypothetical protein BLNAU_4991 [Blattamonas nauphoetae]|uniref:SPRY domain-containing protein n=1 Tax=Blattamonas nauphoetae TaxID=2049346 RepID=A0ABQ9Y8N3_9EUKA|nr:hypothetical protein BLNAU_4991 [Blattamonas nauphoetae]